MAVRAGMAPEAEAHFREALALDAADSDLLGSYADFLLNSDRSSDVVALRMSYPGTRTFKGMMESEATPVFATVFDMKTTQQKCSISPF
jgi:hypothetical protein